MLDPQAITQLVESGIPHARALGFQVVEVGARRARLAMPWRADLVGDPETGVVAGGAVTTLVDTVSGMAVWAALDRPMQIATLDLRIDYLKPAARRARLVAEAECFRITRHIAFVRGRAWEEGAEDDEVAHCVGAFMLESSPLPGKAS